MSTLDATVSMLEVMPEDARIKVYQYARELFSAEKPANPFTQVTVEQVMSDLEISQRQIENGQCSDMQEILTKMGQEYGFV